MAFFYFDFRDANKQRLRDLVPSLLTQLFACSGPCCDILSDLYFAHDKGKNQPSDSNLVKCLKEMLTLLASDQRPTYLIIDALDESPDTSGIPSSRERVLRLVKELRSEEHTSELQSREYISYVDFWATCDAYTEIWKTKLDEFLHKPKHLFTR